MAFKKYDSTYKRTESPFTQKDDNKKKKKKIYGEDTWSLDKRNDGIYEMGMSGDGYDSPGHGSADPDDTNRRLTMTEDEKRNVPTSKISERETGESEWIYQHHPMNVKLDSVVNKGGRNLEYWSLDKKKKKKKK